MPSTSNTIHHGDDARRIARWVLVSSILTSSMAFIDGTALSVALPAMQADLGATGADLLWVTNGFSLPLAALLLLGGSLGDCFGRKRVFVAGVVGFAAASLACGLAPGVRALIAARIIQGVAAALMIPGALAMVCTFHAPAERGRAIGTWSAFSVLATVIGPVLGGLLARAGMWRWVFFINLPLAAIALTLLVWRIPADPPRPRGMRVDWWGALAGTIALAALNHGLLQWAATGPGHSTITSLLLSGLSLFLFVVIQSHVAQPLLPLGVFRSRALAVASAASLLFYAAIHGLLFFLPLNLIQVQGYDPALAGLAQIPLMALVMGLSRFAGGLADRRGPRLLLTLGPAVAGIGFWMLALPGQTAGPKEYATAFLPGLLLVGAGMGLTAAPLSATVIGSMHSDRIGLAAGINSTLSRLAGVLAIAVLGPVAMITFEQSLNARTQGLDLPQEARRQLKQEAVKLAEAQTPPGLSAESSAGIKQSIRFAFIDSFNRIAQLAAVSSWLGCLLAASFLKGHKKILSENAPVSPA